MPALDGPMLTALIVVGLVVIGFILYLAVDLVRGRATKRRMDEQRRLAREAWMREIEKTDEGRAGR